jgi:aubergine-like protein
MLPHEDKVLLNVEMTNKIVRTDTVLQVMQEFRETAPDRSQVKPFVESQICGMVVITLYNQRTYQIEAIEWGKRVTDTFEAKNGPITFLDYFKKYDGVTISDAKQPLLRARNRSKWDDKVILLVPELCNPTGLTEAMKSNFNLMGELKKHMFVEPTKRVEQLKSFMRRLKGLTEVQCKYFARALGILLKQ